MDSQSIALACAGIALVFIGLFAWWQMDNAKKRREEEVKAMLRSGWQAGYCLYMDDKVRKMVWKPLDGGGIMFVPLDEADERLYGKDDGTSPATFYSRWWKA